MFEDIHVFCAVAKHYSFAKAARELGLSTPVVTRRLARLEKELDTRLLNRTTRQVTLTEAGSLFYSDVNELIQTFEASKENVKSLTNNVSGTLKVGIPHSVSHYYVSPNLHLFLAKYPHLKIFISTGTEQFNLLNNGYDLIVHCGELPNSSFYYKKIGTMKKIICASPEYLKKHGTPKHYTELSTHNCLSHQDSIHHNWIIEDKGKAKGVLVSGNVNINNTIDLKNLVKAGIGIGYLPHYSVQEELKNGSLISILDEFQPADHELHAIYPHNKYLNKKAKLFLEFISGLLNDVCIGGCKL